MRQRERYNKLHHQYFSGGGRIWGKCLHIVPQSGGRTGADLMTASDLNWTVDKSPALFVGPDGYTHKTPDRFITYRSDTGDYLGDVGATYAIEQNESSIALADEIVASGQAHWLAGGHTRGGARCHALMELDRDIDIGVEGEDYIAYLMLRWGHDGGISQTIAVGGFRIACLNGMTVPLATPRVWKGRHTAGLHDRIINEARKALKIAWNYWDEFEFTAKELVNAEVSSSGERMFYENLMPLPPDVWQLTEQERLSDRRVILTVNRRERLQRFIAQSDNLDNVRGTAYGLLQGVAEWHQWEQPTRRGRSADEIRFERSTEPQSIVDRAFAIVTAH